MKSDFDQRIKNMEQELTNLKSATEFTSIKSASFSASTNVRTGYYQIIYEANDGILSQVYCGSSSGVWGMAYARTPNGNSQIVEITSDKGSGGSIVTYDVPLVIASNSPVISITRL